MLAMSEWKQPLSLLVIKVELSRFLHVVDKVNVQRIMEQLRGGHFNSAASQIEVKI